jgi:hypothetical protein
MHRNVSKKQKKNYKRKNAGKELAQLIKIKVEDQKRIKKIVVPSGVRTHDLCITIIGTKGLAPPLSLSELGVRFGSLASQ